MTVELLEAKVMLVGVDFAYELGNDRVVLEGDSKRIIDRLNSKSDSFATVGVLVHDIRQGAANFVNFNFLPKGYN